MWNNLYIQDLFVAKTRQQTFSSFRVIHSSDGSFESKIYRVILIFARRRIGRKVNFRRLFGERSIEGPTWPYLISRLLYNRSIKLWSNAVGGEGRVGHLQAVHGAQDLIPWNGAVTQSHLMENHFRGKLEGEGRALLPFSRSSKVKHSIDFPSRAPLDRSPSTLWNRLPLYFCGSTLSMLGLSWLTLFPRSPPF